MSNNSTNSSSGRSRSNSGSDDSPSDSSRRHDFHVEDLYAFPRDDRDFASAFMDAGANEELNRTRKPYQ